MAFGHVAWKERAEPWLDEAGFVLVMSPDLKQRLLCTRTCDGRGAAHSVDVRTSGGRTRAVFAGSGMTDGMFTRKAIQEKPGDASGEKNDPQDGFFVVIGAEP